MLRCGMERASLLEHLEQARRHVAEASKHVSWQRKIVAGLRPDADVIDLAQELLRVFEEALAKHSSEQQRLERELRTAAARDGARPLSPPSGG
jgi:hypothetical protein